MPITLRWSCELCELLLLLLLLLYQELCQALHSVYRSPNFTFSERAANRQLFASEETQRSGKVAPSCAAAGRLGTPQAQASVMVLAFTARLEPASDRTVRLRCSDEVLRFL